MRSIRVLTLAFLAVALPVTAYADAVDDSIKARRGYFQLVKHNAGVLFGMAKGDIAYDAATASAHAGNLNALAMMSTGSLWPAGSDNDAKFGDTRALPKIWGTYPAIIEKHEAFQQAAGNLAAAAGGGLDSLRGAVGPLGQACKACHDDFRAKDF